MQLRGGRDDGLQTHGQQRTGGQIQAQVLGRDQASLADLKQRPLQRYQLDALGRLGPRLEQPRAR